MARTGPVTRDTSTIALGLAQIRVGKFDAESIASASPVLGKDDSIGALASTTFTSNVEYWRLTSGFPALEDMVVPLSETAALECQFKEISPYNLALAKGMDPEQFKDNAHQGTIALGTVKESAPVRMEAHYTFPNGVNTIDIIFPRAQVTSSVELAFQAEDNANPTITFEAKRADSEVSVNVVTVGGTTTTIKGSAVWDEMPLGCIVFGDGSAEDDNG